MTPTVDLRAVASYEPEAVFVAIRKAINAVWENRPEYADLTGKRVVIKPNLLKANSPDDAVTTHPEVVAATAAVLMERGATVLLAESPGGPYTEPYLRSVYRACGMEAAANRTGFLLNYDTEKSLVDNPKGVRLKQIEVIQAVLDAGLVVNIPKLKTHGMMMVTAAVKNLFGVVPGLSKIDYHFRIRDVEHFAEQLVDIADFVSPTLSIIDGITGMDGNGPSAGEVTHPGVLIVSDSVFAADTAAVRLTGLDRHVLPTIEAAKNRGLPGASFEDLRFTGDPPESFRIEPYRLPDSSSLVVTGGILPSFLEIPLRNRLTPKPAVIQNLCVQCGICKKHCPAKCIELSPYPTFDYKACIRCFCCHELCPKRAIEIRTNRLYEWLIHR